MCAWPIVCNMHQPKRTHISVQDAAKLLGESRWTTQRRIRNGELAAEMIGGAFILDAAEVLKLAATIANEATARAEAITAAVAGMSGAAS